MDEAPPSGNPRKSLGGSARISRHDVSVALSTRYSPRYTRRMDTTTKVDSKTRDRLAVLAEAHRTTMRALIEEFAESTLTPAELKERADHTAVYLAEHFGVTV